MFRNFVLEGGVLGGIWVYYAAWYCRTGVFRTVLFFGGTRDCFVGVLVQKGDESDSWERWWAWRSPLTPRGGVEDHKGFYGYLSAEWPPCI